MAINSLQVAIKLVSGSVVRGFSAAGQEKLSLVLLSLPEVVRSPLIGCFWVGAFPRTACSTPAGSSKLKIRPALWQGPS